MNQLQTVPLSPVELDKLYKRVELEMRGIDPAVLLSYSWFCIAAATHLGIEVTKRCVNGILIFTGLFSKPSIKLLSLHH